MTSVEARLDAEGTEDPPRCGEAPLPGCPLQVWMEGNAALPLRQGDYRTLARSLASLAQGAPPGFGDWSDIATRGAAAARRGDAAQVRESCAACHHGHRDEYRRRLRSHPWIAAPVEGGGE